MATPDSDNADADVPKELESLLMLEHSSNNSADELLLLHSTSNLLLFGLFQKSSDDKLLV